MFKYGVIRIDCDSQSVIFLANNLSYHSKINHIDVQYHFVRDMVEDKRVLSVKVETLKNVTDALKKSVRTHKFSWCREKNGCCKAKLIIKLSCFPLRKENNKWENVGYVLYSFHD